IPSTKSSVRLPIIFDETTAHSVFAGESMNGELSDTELKIGWFTPRLIINDPGTTTSDAEALPEKFVLGPFHNIWAFAELSANTPKKAANKREILKGERASWVLIRH